MRGPSGTRLAPSTSKKSRTPLTSAHIEGPHALVATERLVSGTSAPLDIWDAAPSIDWPATSAAKAYRADLRTLNAIRDRPSATQTQDIGTLAGTSRKNQMKRSRTVVRELASALDHTRLAAHDILKGQCCWLAFRRLP